MLSVSEWLCSFLCVGFICHVCCIIITSSLLRFCIYFDVIPISDLVAGFFGDLLSLVCQSFSMVDMVVLLHGNHQPLSRIQPELATFFNEHYLNGQEPTDANIAVCLALFLFWKSLSTIKTEKTFSGLVVCKNDL